MRRPLSESTNTKNSEMAKDKNKAMTDKECVTEFLTEVSNRTKDYSLKYDIGKCLEIIDGKENQEITELKEEFVKIYEEREALFLEKCDLKLENEYLRAKVDEKTGDGVFDE